MCGYTVLRPRMSLVGNAPHTVSLSIVPTAILCDPLTTIFRVWRVVWTDTGKGATTVRNTWYTLYTVIPAVCVELSLVASIQYLLCQNS